MNNTFGFIMTRHVNSEKTNLYWNHSVKLLRSLYPNTKIIIIDDNSNQEYVKSEFNYKNITIIQSEFKGRGELLPYYYYIKNKFFENAVIIHDSVFIQKRIRFELFNNIKVLPLWFFYPDKENIDNTLRITKNLKNKFPIESQLTLNSVVLGMPHEKWFGCFGVQSYINHDFLLYLNTKYNLVNLISAVSCRPDRCCLERIFGCIFYTEYPQIIKYKSLFGQIHGYQRWGYTFDEYMKNINDNKKMKSVIKVWTGR
jgi:hypothetical protein